MVVLLDSHEQIEMDDRFLWASIKQCKTLLHESNTLNTDSRSVLACLPIPERYRRKRTATDFEYELEDWEGDTFMIQDVGFITEVKDLRIEARDYTKETITLFINFKNTPIYRVRS